MAKLATFSSVGLDSDEAVEAHRNWEHVAERVEETRRPRVRLAHVGIGSSGVDDVELAVLCPRCDAELILGDPEERALQRVLALRTKRARPSRPRAPAQASGDRMLVLREASVAQVMDAAAPVLPSALLLAEVANALAQRDTDAAVVVDAEGRPLGLVTAADVLRAAYLHSERVSELAVCHALSSTLYKVRADAPLSAALALFQESGARHVVAVADDGTVVGLVRPEAVLGFLAAD